MYYLFIAFDFDHSATIEFPFYEPEVENLLKTVLGEMSILATVKGQLLNGSKVKKINYLIRELEYLKSYSPVKEPISELISLLKKI